MILAYVDPSILAYVVQAVAGTVIALGVVLGVVIRKLRKRADKALRKGAPGEETETNDIRVR